MDISLIAHRRLHNTWLMLKITYGLLFIVAGADKFMNLVTHWEKYVSPYVSEQIPAHKFIMLVGIIEIAIGLMVFLRPRLGGFAVAAWFIAIVVNLLSMNLYFDIAVRDLVMAVGALAFAELTRILEEIR